MKLEEAIEIVTGILKDEDLEWEQDGSDALKLLIEAGKRVKRLRDKRFPVMGAELPGEME